MRQLLTCVRVNLLFYRRNRLLLLVAIVLLFIFLVSVIPSLLFETSNQRFSLVSHVFQSLNEYLFLFAAALGLLAVSSHLRDRSIKMVVTKPLPPEMWLLSHFLSAVLMFVALAAGAVALSAALLWGWGIPFQAGLLYLAGVTVASCLIVFSYLTFLSSVMHPAVAGLVALTLQEATFRALSELAASGGGVVSSPRLQGFLDGDSTGALLRLLGPAQLRPVPGGGGAGAGELSGGDRRPRHPAALLVYSLVLSALLFLLAVAALRRRRLI